VPTAKCRGRRHRSPRRSATELTVGTGRPSAHSCLHRWSPSAQNGWAVTASWAAPTVVRPTATVQPSVYHCADGAVLYRRWMCRPRREMCRRRDADGHRRQSRCRRCISPCRRCGAVGPRRVSHSVASGTRTDPRPQRPPCARCLPNSSHEAHLHHGRAYMRGSSSSLERRHPPQRLAGAAARR
jgi:hypothetical protein